jgi:hypothetical protein
MNLPIPLFALMAARQANDSPADAGRVALVSMLVRPPILGLLLGVVMARQASAAPAAPASSTTPSGTTGLQGRSVLDQVAPETDLHSFLPSFLGFTRHQAQEFAKELRLTPYFVEDQSAEAPQSKQRVVSQEPGPGAGWPKDRNVTLLLSHIHIDAPRSHLHEH